ncbi:helix-turn-helix transcriptional regulator [Olivibacter domesticus]|uniref:AraC-type DNA-binding protein n=1 Tax=Olivibacter domesticus TaxID=407022 RepID=A0A1H7HTM7_OLID1|nr:AraC family transcriptional regulator [Olivibacter domesticus]SEK53007.1 AraC-type DNA-binding protein [Olivibacter domesticus]
MEEIEAQQICFEKGIEYTDIEDISASILYNADGIEIFAVNTSQERDLIVRDCQSEPYLNMYFSIQGLSSAKPLDTGQEYTIETNQHIVGYTPSFEGDYSLRGRKIETFGICMQEAYFNRLVATDLPCLQRFWEDVHAGKEADISRTPMPITRQQRAVINEISDCVYTGQMRKLYIESKVTELFFLQAQQADNLPVGGYLPIKAADEERLRAAKKFVQQHILEPLTLKQISREVGLNDFKLKKGFKQLFGSTVFDYFIQCRMEYARKVLLDTRITIAEIAYSLGYSDPYNFSKAFRKHFGYLPSQL